MAQSAGAADAAKREAGTPRRGSGHEPAEKNRASSGRRRGRAERSTRRFFLIAALILVLLSLAAYLIPLALPIPPRVIGAISWRPTAIGAAITIGLLLWELRGAWVMLALGIGLIELPLLVMRATTLTTLATFSQTLLIGLVLGFVGTVVLRLSRAADIAGADRERAATTAAAAAGANAARARAAALVHDEVLSTLGLASAPDRVDRHQLATLATSTRALLADASDDRPRTSVVDALREDVLALDPAAVFTVSGIEPTEAPAILSSAPPAVLPVLRSAVRQALRNSLLHAGHQTRRSVAVAHSATSFSVTVTDDGMGFNPAQVSVHRLGLRTTAHALRSVGGEAAVLSGPGAGTRVEIVWPAIPAAPMAAANPASTEAERAAAAGTGTLPPSEPAVETLRLAEVPLVRIASTVTGAAFVVTQAMLAAVATSTAHTWWAPLLAVLLLFTAALLLARRSDARFDAGRTALTLALITAALLTGLLGAPFEIGDLWFAGAASFLLTALAFRGRPLAAVAGSLVLSALLAGGGMAHDAPAFMSLSVTVRPTAVALFAVGLTFAIAGLLRRIAREFAATEAEAAHEAWERSAHAELAARAAEVRLLVDGTLGEIALGRPLTAQHRARAAALEGHLRDRIRAGRLAVEPLLTAVMGARERGVDVLLFDDLEGELPEHFDLHSAATVIAAACAAANDRVAVRILPAGRAAVVSLVVDGTQMPFENH